MRVPILSVATATPSHELTQSDALAMAQDICCIDERQRRLASALYRKSGVETRHTCVPYTEAYQWAPPRPPGETPITYVGPSTQVRMAMYEEHAPPLAIQAAREALVRSDIPPGEITHVITVSCTGFTAPGIDNAIIRELKLHPTTQRTHIGYMGCHGAINGLRVARGLAHAQPRSRILLCAVELCSLHYCFHWDSERMLGNALFADGAGAIVLGSEPDAPVSRARGRWQVAATGSCLFPETAEILKWNIEDHGFAMTISSRLPELIQVHLCEWLTAWLADNNLRVSDVQSWAVHPGGPKILEAVESAMGIDAEKTQVSRDVLHHHGNMSSATVLFILESLLKSGASTPCVALSFGPGLVAEAALLL
ncbi:MAG TPA: type III polyketide synthase [Lacipirellulaceae bacterium]|nr:type III polyketide synthase [Lacipirellulaceae bacterium]